MRPPKTTVTAAASPAAAGANSPRARKGTGAAAKTAKTGASCGKSAQKVSAAGRAPAIQAAAHDAATGPDLSSPQLYLSRELTWLRFNSRVLKVAADSRTPLLERVKFLSITSSNLDEFFMKRIGGLMQQVAAGVTTCTADGLSPQEQIDRCIAYVRIMLARQQKAAADIVKALRANNIFLLGYGDLSGAEKK